MAVRPIDANALARRIREYMDDFLNATTRHATCRAILSMLGDENQTPTLRTVSREQVEKMRGEWITKHYVDGILEGTNFDECSKCGYQRVFKNPELKTKYMFCPGCGRAMWDEAVDMVMERLEEMHADTGSV